MVRSSSLLHDMEVHKYRVGEEGANERKSLSTSRICAPGCPLPLKIRKFVVNWELIDAISSRVGLFCAAQFLDVPGDSHLKIHTETATTYSKTNSILTSTVFEREM